MKMRNRIGPEIPGSHRITLGLDLRLDRLNYLLSTARELGVDPHVGGPSYYIKINGKLHGITALEINFLK